MNLLFLTSCGAFDVFLIRAVREHWPQAAVLRIGAPAAGMTDSRRAALRRAPLRTGLRYAEQLLFYRPYKRRVERRVSRQLFGTDVPPALENVVDVPHAALHSPETLALIASLAPDVLIVSAAPLLKPQLYSLARLAAVNVHRGISPNYRGESTLFWPLDRRDYKNVGVTIHQLDPGIDSGPIVAQARLAVGRHDSEADLLAAAARKSADLIVDYLRSREQNSDRPLAEQAGSVEPGRLYPSRNRRLWHDARVYMRRLLGRQGDG